MLEMNGRAVQKIWDGPESSTASKQLQVVGDDGGTHQAVSTAKAEGEKLL